MTRSSCPFGEYLKQLIKEAGMSQCEFYTMLGIKKPYFYDIVSGRINPPPHDVQFRAVDILNIDGEKRDRFFDLAAKARGDIPADITKSITENPSMLTDIRSEIKQKKY